MDIEKYKKIDNIFKGCSSLLFFPNIAKWNCLNIIHQNNFNNYIDESISSKNSSNIYITIFINSDNANSSSFLNNLNALFYECSSLKSLPDISKWNTNNVIDMSLLFCKCSSLELLPDISKCDTNNVTNMNGLFYGCSSLKSLIIL